MRFNFLKNTQQITEVKPNKTVKPNSNIRNRTLKLFKS